jgi:hypothetical protein
MAQPFLSWSDRRDAAAVEALAVALRGRQTPLVSFDPDTATPPEPSALVVFLSDHLLESSGDRLEAVVGSWPGPVIPVALAPLRRDPPPAIADISWIEAHAEPADAAAARIALGVRTSPRWLLAWQEVRSAADGNGSGPASLLDEGALERAQDTIRTRPHDLLPDVPSEILALLRESRRQLARRRRIRLALALGAVIVLSAIALLAFLQRHSATVAEGHAKDAARLAEADRLSHFAQQELDSDPDRPVLLARRAYELNPGAQSREALRRSLDAAPWHKSFRLSFSPLRLATSPHSPLLAVVAEDASVRLLDSRSGREVAAAEEPPSAHGAPVVSASADGRSLALVYPGGLIQVRRLVRTFPLVLTRHLRGMGRKPPRSAAWLDREQELLIAWGRRGISALDLASGQARLVRDTGVSAPVAVAASPRLHLMAIAGRRGAAILRAGTLRPCWTGSWRSQGQPTLVFDEPAGALVLARSPYALQTRIPPSCGVSGAETPERDVLLWSDGEVAAALPGGGVAMAGAADGHLALYRPPAIYPAGDFPAHLPAVSGVGVAGDALVSVGPDRWMRVWRLPAPPAYPVGPGWNIFLNEGVGERTARATWRSMIASDPTGSRVTVGGTSTGSLSVLRANRLGDPLRSYFVFLGTSVRPAPASPCAALVFSGTARLYRCEGAKLREVWSHRYTDSASGIFDTALSEDGRVVAVAGLGSIAVTQTAHDTVRLVEFDDPAALTFGRGHDLFAVDSDGTVLRVPSEGRVRRVGLPLGSCRIGAAGLMPSGEQVLFGCVDGEAIIAATGNGEVLGRFELGVDLSQAIDIRISRDGALAAIVGRDGYWILDLRRRRIVAAGEAYDEREVGAQPRDATFLGSGRSVLVLRADEGIDRIDLSRWRFLDGDALLRATAGAVPR